MPDDAAPFPGVIHDLTRPIGSGPTDTWDTPEKGMGLRYRFRYRRHWSLGDNGSQAEVLIDEHYGTHVDAPDHVIRGTTTVDRLDLRRLTGSAVVLDCRPWTGQGITARVLDAVGAEVRAGDIVLLCSSEPAVRPGTLPEVQTHLLPSGAEWLVARGVASIGMETLGLEHVHEGIVERRCYEPTDTDPWPAHRIVLEHDIYIIEGLADLSALAGQRVAFVGLPLPIVGGSGSPIRAIAWA
jgi:kynurenine formamidase